MERNLYEKLAEEIESRLKKYDFENFELSTETNDLLQSKIWRRRTWNTNRAVLLVQPSEIFNSAYDFIRYIKKDLGKNIGYIPVLYELGLQVIIVSDNFNFDEEQIFKYVAKYNNQTVLVQSIHIINIEKRSSLSKRAWGQFITGKFQDIIEEVLKSYLEKVNLND